MGKRGFQTDASRQPSLPPRKWPAHLDHDPDDVGDASDDEWFDADSLGISVSELRQRRAHDREYVPEHFVPADDGGKVFKVRDPFPEHDPDGEAGCYWDVDEIDAGEALIIAADSIGVDLTVEALGRHWLHGLGPDAVKAAARRLMKLAKRRQNGL